MLTLECPNCFSKFHPQPSHSDVSGHSNLENRSFIFYQICPNCKVLLIYLKTNVSQSQISDFYRINKDNLDVEEFGAILIHPKKKHKPLSTDIPQDFVNDFTEASDVLSLSPKASAALSRRCLQKLLLAKATVTAKNLFDQIQEVLTSNQLPSDLAGAIDAIRTIGNFAAHPIKSTNSGSIMDVEPGEAEWTLDVLYQLLDFYFVRPAELQRRKNTLNQKLTQAGKPTIQ